jgi:hypothetical protein
MSAVVQKSYIDHSIEYLAQTPSDFFNSIRNVLTFVKYATGKSTKGLTAAISTFGMSFDAFNTIYLVDNLNTFKNYMFGKKVKDISILFSDLLNNVCEVVALSVTAGIIPSYALNWFMSGSGATLMYSSGKRVFNEITDNKPLNNNEEKIKMLSIAKNVALFAMGIILFATGWFGCALNVFLLTVFGSVTVISGLASHIINKSTKMSAA